MHFYYDRVSMEVSTSNSKLVYKLFRGRNQPTYIGIIIHLLSTMDIPVSSAQKKMF